MTSVTSAQILIWFLLFTFIADSSNYDKFILFYGETQTGKSTMINAISDKNVAKSGKGKGISVTEYPTIYSKSFTKDESYGIPEDFTLFMMDTPGNLDNRGILTDADILNGIVTAISQINNIQQIDVIFMTESLSGDSLQLTRNLGKLRKIFGSEVDKSVVVLGTKPELGMKANAGEREKEAKELCDELGIKYISYESKKQYHHNAQLKAFMDILFRSNIPPYYMKQVEVVREKIKQRAQELMDETPKKEELIQVPKQVIKYKDVQKTENYVDKEWGVVGRGERKYVIAGSRKKIYGWIPVTKTRTITVKEPYEVTEMENQKVVIEHDPVQFEQLAWEEHKEATKLKSFIKQEL